MAHHITKLIGTNDQQINRQNYLLCRKQSKNQANFDARVRKVLIFNGFNTPQGDPDSSKPMATGFEYVVAAQWVLLQELWVRDMIGICKMYTNAPDRAIYNALMKVCEFNTYGGRNWRQEGGIGAVLGKMLTGKPFPHGEPAWPLSHEVMSIAMPRIPGSEWDERCRDWETDFDPEY